MKCEFKNEELFNAVMANDADKVWLLLHRGADPHEKDKHGWTLLMVAALYGYADVGKELLDKGVDPTAVGNDTMTALQIAKGRKHADFIRLLENAGVEK